VSVTAVLGVDIGTLSSNGVFISSTGEILRQSTGAHSPSRPSRRPRRLRPRPTSAA